MTPLEAAVTVSRMARAKLESVKLLRNHGARVVYVTPARRTERYVGPDGYLSVPEASALLRMSRTQLYRMARSGRVDLVAPDPNAGGAHRVPLVVCRLLAAMSKTKRGTTMGGNVLESYDPKRRRVRPRKDRS